MDIHKPKPIHNWREFVKELGTIALGVSIALAAEQAVEWLHWRTQVTTAKEIIASEMARNISYGIERIRMGQCLQSRLLEIENILADASRTGMLPPLGQIGSPNLVPWPSSAWESVVASQAATHFPRQQLALLSLTYSRVQRNENWNLKEVEVWSILDGISGPSRRFDPAVGAEWQRALALARLYNIAITGTARTFTLQIQSQNLPFTAEEQRSMAEAKKAPLDAVTCGPLSAVPSLAVTQTSDPRFIKSEEFVKSLSFGRQR